MINLLMVLVIKLFDRPLNNIILDETGSGREKESGKST